MIAMGRHRVLDWIERAGNHLPDPSAMFIIGAAAVMVLSQIAASLDWSVAKTVLVDGNPQTSTVSAVGLLASDGLWWTASHLVENFVRFPPLGIVLVGMLGIGLAERSGLIPALLQHALARAPAALMTPGLVLLGVLSSLGLDAGYVVLPPIAAALYQAAGRSPLAGVAAVFAGVSAGFSANLFITAVDPLVAGFTQAGAQVIDAGYRVAVTANWWFMIASTVVLTLTGWFVTARLVEPRLGGPAGDPMVSAQGVQPPPPDNRGLLAAAIAFGTVVLLAVAAVVIPGAPLYGGGEHFARWIEATVPLLFLAFFVPALVYGRCAGTIRGSGDAARMLGETMAGLGPYIVLAFFAAQFIALFKHSNLGEMLAIVGGNALAEAEIPPALLTVVFVAVVGVANLFIGSMSAKYAFFAPVFVPMFMLAGVSPELTQAAYRVGDSVTNVITPLNPYFIIILALIKRYAPASGIGTVVALMLPYAVVFGVVWSALLVAWVTLGVALGPGGGLSYPPP